MRYVLARANRQALERLDWSNVLLAFDFDGTLAPIVSDPGRARLRASTRRLLAALARECPCVVISGRGRADTLRRLRGLRIAEVIGNHGIEPWQASARVRDEVARWQGILERRLGALPGVRIENKSFSIAVHYRQARLKQRARAAIHEAARALGKVRVLGGILAVNLLPAGLADKGSSLEKARTRLRRDTAVYVGDDETDEDVFAFKQPGRLLTIRVGRRKGSLAAYYVRGQGEIDDLLRVLRSSAHRWRARSEGESESGRTSGLRPRRLAGARRSGPQTPGRRKVASLRR